MALSNSIHALSPSVRAALEAGKPKTSTGNESSLATRTSGAALEAPERSAADAGFGALDVSETLACGLQPTATITASSAHEKRFITDFRGIATTGTWWNGAPRGARR